MTWYPQIFNFNEDTEETTKSRFFHIISAECQVLYKN